MATMKICIKQYCKYKCTGIASSRIYILNMFVILCHSPSYFEPVLNLYI